MSVIFMQTQEKAKTLDPRSGSGMTDKNKKTKQRLWIPDQVGDDRRRQCRRSTQDSRQKSKGLRRGPAPCDRNRKGY